MTLGVLGTTLSVVRTPTDYLAACEPSSLVDFALVPEFARQAVCTLYSGLRNLQSRQNRGAYIFVSQLLRVGPLLVTLLSYESFRQRSFWGRRGASLFLILAQVLSGAVSVPLYFANLCTGESRDPKGKKKEGIAALNPRLGQVQEWSIFASMTVGYLAPLAYGIWARWSNKAITTFLCFPIYIMIINTGLPLVLNHLRMQSKSMHPPLLLSCLITVLLSLDGHIKLLFSDIPLKHIFWPSHTAIGMTQDLHALLLHDYAFVLLEIASFVFLYTYRNTSGRDKAKAAKLGLIIGILAGPVAGMSVIWTLQELRSEIPDSKDATARSEGERTALLD